MIGKLKDFIFNKTSKTKEPLEDIFPPQRAVDVIKAAYPDIVFDVDVLSDGEPHLLRGTNYNVFANSFPTVANLMRQAKNLVPEIPMPDCDIANIQIEPSLISEYQDVTQIKLSALTKTQKAPKCPVQITFHTILPSANYGDFSKDNFFGYISYYSTGKICNAKLVRWKDRKLFSVNASEKSGELSVQRVEKTDSSKQTYQREALYVRSK